MYGVLYGRTEVVRILLEGGTNPSRTNVVGHLTTCMAVTFSNRTERACIVGSMSKRARVCR